MNRARLPHYAALGGAQAQLVSATLITSEVATMPVAHTFDARAFLLQKAGVPILCDELVPMSAAPAAGQPGAPPPPPPALLWSYPAGDLKDDVRQAYRRGGFPAASARLEAALEELAPYPAYLCMTRHLLESTLRAANLAPVHEAAARRARVGWLGPRAISWDFIQVQLEALALGLTLDRLAAPLQAQGLPIRCADLPPIPPGP